MATEVQSNATETAPLKSPPIKIPSFFERLWIKFTALFTMDTNPFDKISDTFSKKPKSWDGINVKHLTIIAERSSLHRTYNLQRRAAITKAREISSPELKALDQQIAAKTQEISRLKGRIASSESNEREAREYSGVVHDIGSYARDRSRLSGQVNVAEGELRELESQQSAELSRIINENQILFPNLPSTELPSNYLRLVASAFEDTTSKIIAQARTLQQKDPTRDLRSYVTEVAALSVPWSISDEDQHVLEGMLENALKTPGRSLS